MNQDIDKILFTKQDIEKKVKQLGKKISLDYDGKKLLMVGILKGSVVFIADLMRYIELPLNIDFISVSSYGSLSESSGEIKFEKDLSVDISGYDVLIIEDILDTGLTLSYVKNLLLQRNPESLKICTLLDKRQRRKAQIEADYVGFAIPDEFVVGYGLDYNENYRNMPDIGILKKDVYSNVHLITAKEGVKTI